MWFAPLALVRLVLDAFQFCVGSFTANISGVEGRFWLEQNDMHFLVGDGKMLDTPGDDDEFTWSDDFLTIAETHAQLPRNHQKHFVFAVVMVPDKFALELDDLHVGIV